MNYEIKWPDGKKITHRKLSDGWVQAMMPGKVPNRIITETKAATDRAAYAKRGAVVVEETCSQS